MRWNRDGAGAARRKVLGGRELHLRGVRLSERNDSEEKCGLILSSHTMSSVSSFTTSLQLLSKIHTLITLSW